MDYSWVPNLDGFATADEVVQMSRVLRKLSEYARTKALAMQERAVGRIDQALRHEHNCEVLYNDLPEGARW